MGTTGSAVYTMSCLCPGYCRQYMSLSAESRFWHKISISLVQDAKCTVTVQYKNRFLMMVTWNYYAVRGEKTVHTMLSGWRKPFTVLCGCENTNYCTVRSESNILYISSVLYCLRWTTMRGTSGVWGTVHSTDQLKPISHSLNFEWLNKSGPDKNQQSTLLKIISQGAKNLIWVYWFLVYKVNRI
jgi:hypothetical protein